MKASEGKRIRIKRLGWLWVVIAVAILVWGYWLFWLRPKSERARQEIAEISMSEQERIVLGAIAADLERRVGEPVVDIAGEDRDEILSRVTEGKETWSRKDFDFGETELFYWNEYELRLPPEEIILAEIRGSVGKTLILRLEGDWMMQLYLDGYSGGFDRDWLSDQNQEGFDFICREHNLSDETLAALKKRLQGKYLFDNDLDLMRHIWGRDWSVMDLETLSLTELIEAYYFMNVKEVLSAGYLQTIKELSTDYFEGMLFGNNTSEWHFDLYDKDHWLNIVCHIHGEAKAEQFDAAIAQKVIASIQRIESQMPGEDMLAAAEKYLESEGQGHLVMIFTKAAQQFELGQEASRRIDKYEAQVIETFITDLGHTEMPRREQAAYQLGRRGVEDSIKRLGIDDSRVVDSLIVATEDIEPQVRKRAVSSLYSENPETIKKILPILLERMSDTDPEVRTAAVGGIPWMGADEKTIEAVIAAVKDVDPRVRESAVLKLLNMRLERELVEPIFKEALQDDDERVRSTAEWALESRAFALSPPTDEEMCRNNLEYVIFPEIEKYLKENNGSYPEKLSDILGKDPYANRILLCPATDDAPGECSYVYRAGDWGVTEGIKPEMVVIYDKRENHAGGFRHVGWADGTVKKMTEEEFQEAIEKDNQGRRELGLVEKDAEGRIKRE